MRISKFGLFVAAATLMALSGTAVAQTGPLQYYAITPCRLVDTRNANGPQGGPILGGTLTRSFPVAGLCSIPTTAKAASLNVTTVGTNGSGNIRFWPYGITMPLVATMNFDAGEPAIANGAIVPLASYAPTTPGDPTTNFSISSYLAIQAGYTAHLVIDVTGYFQ
jgi:chitodextrinase